MSLPTTAMKGHESLRDKISIALGRCQEQQWLDFKESQPWPVLKLKLIRTIMAMANLRDGGLILIGISERDETWKLTGISTQHLSTYDFDDILDQVNSYGSPEVGLDVVTHRSEDDKIYLALAVHQFRETPVVCKRGTPAGVVAKEQMRPGDFFIRPAGKPRTERVSDAHRLHELLELAAIARARRMLEVGNRVGFVSPEAAKSKFAQEISSISNIPVPVTKQPYWRVIIRPDSYKEELIKSRSQILDIVQKNHVKFRGWDFPHLSHRDDERGQGSNWVASWCHFMGQIEYWRFFQSGQLAHYASVREVTEDEWRPKLQAATASHLRHVKNVDWNSVPGFISIINLVYNFTEYFEFAARLAQADIFEGAVAIQVTATGVQGFVLTAELNRCWHDYCPAHENLIEKEWTIPTDRLIAESTKYSLEAVGWFLESFGWMNPNLDAMANDQRKLIQRQL
jgi:schlafen family protein